MLAAELVLHLSEVWATFNQATELRSAIAGSQARLAATVYEEASRDMLVMIVTRLLDRPAKERA